MKNFGNRIKALRRKMNLTQEELAERLNVSYQTISKWETNASLPDITMFPILANFFNVSTDELLGVDLAKKQAKIDEIIAEYDRLSNLGKEKEKFDFICRAYHAYPNDEKILQKYIWMLYYDPYFWEKYWDLQEKGKLTPDHPKVPHMEELIMLCERILKECFDEQIRYDAISLLSGIYGLSGDEKKAIEYIKLLPTALQVGEMRELYKRGSENWWKYAREELHGISEDVYVKIRNCANYAPTNQEAIRIYKKAVDFIKMIYDEGDYGFSHYHLSEAYLSMASRYCCEEDYELCAKYLDLSLAHAKAYDELPEKTVHTSFLVKDCEFERSRVNSGYECNDVQRRLGDVCKIESFGSIRNEQWFVDIVEKYAPFAKDTKS